MIEDQKLLQITARYNQVLNKIADAAISKGRKPESIRLVVVTKRHTIETIRAALKAGIRDLGENYAEEAEEKITSIGKTDGLKWHMIGHVQSRKANLVARSFDFIHSVDSFKLAGKLDRFAFEQGRKLPILLECNVDGDENKFGYKAFDQTAWNSLLLEFENIAKLPNLEIRGLMTMPPLFDNAEKARPSFKKLSNLKEYLTSHLPEVCWNELSMGTSKDYETAVEEGATLVRVGTAILGSRLP